MFTRNKKVSAFPIGLWGKPKKSHTKRNAFIIAGASALMLGIAGALGKQDQTQ